MFFSWWYTEELGRVWRFTERFFLYLYDLFSVEVCLKTLFAVWRRDQIETRGLPLSEILEAWGLNFASRIVGFCVKLFTMIAYLIATLAFIGLGFCFFSIWLLFPVVVIGIIFLGIKISSGY